ncbi:MAG: hypothetical protein HC908_07830 [Calothrix sp. SM1_7_51]|nr:hypothetical protein [Calothrix sp. SM1_7_51]
MKKPLFHQGFMKVVKVGITASAFALVTSAISSQPTYAAGTTFYCGMSEGLPVTFARTQDGKKYQMIRWIPSRNFPPPWTAQRRCVEVSRRFQKNFDNGTLRFITTGSYNGFPVICAARNRFDDCTVSTILFTLRQGTDPTEILQTLLDRRGLAAGRAATVRGPFSAADNPSITGDASNATQTDDVDTPRNLIIDFDKYINNASVESKPPQPEVPSPGNTSAP